MGLASSILEDILKSLARLLDTRAVVELRGGPRGPGPPERPGGPLETPGLTGYKGPLKGPPLKSPVKFNT